MAEGRRPLVIMIAPSDTAAGSACHFDVGLSDGALWRGSASGSLIFFDIYAVAIEAGSEIASSRGRNESAPLPA